MGGTIATKGEVKGATPPALGTPRVEPSGGRATPKGPAFSNYLAAARPVLKGAESVASVLPGGPIVAAAIRAPQALAPGSAGGVSAPLGGVPMVPRAGSVPASGSAATPSGASLATSPTAGVGQAAGAEGAGGIESVLADSQAFNLYYLQLQEQISAENRQFSTLSNVLKARHDTVKNAIGNIR
jgi:hypothetical protein